MSYSVVFFGTSDFAVPSLKALLADPRFEVKAIVTQPDQPVGRHQVMTAPPVKAVAQEHGLPVFQFEKIKAPEALSKLAEFKADFFVVASYGQIIPQSVLDLPKIGPINVHGSLLPRWRGASCVQAAIAAGDEESGITIMLMDALMDHGPIIAQAATKILADDTGASLHDRLADLGAQNLPDVLDRFAQGNLKAIEQDHAKATTCKLLKRDDGKIDWSKPAEDIERLVRAYNPWPSAWLEWDKKRIKILQANVPSIPNVKKNPGELCSQAGKLMVNCGDDKALEILELQPEGKKPMTAKEFLAGHPKI